MLSCIFYNKIVVTETENKTYKHSPPHQMIYIPEGKKPELEHCSYKDQKAYGLQLKCIV